MSRLPLDTCELRPGDHVRFSTGEGPLMAVVRQEKQGEDDWLVCYWWDAGRSEFRQLSVPAAVLVHEPREESGHG